MHRDMTAPSEYIQLSTLLYLALHFFVYNHVSIKKTGNDTYVKTKNNEDIRG